MVERKPPTKPRAGASRQPAPEAAEPVGRFYDLQQEVTPVEPYVLTENITLQPLTRKQVRMINAASDDDTANRAALGEHFDEVIALYDTRPPAEWEAFVRDFYRHMYGKAVEQAPGKSEESSS